ncbi:hypothetical protein H8E88_02810 [candidate division KSB1 bacterium]|nr:hypothetical protein [candidate division KSB1 bacterium]MBL7093234.1 hypothetical protein [candidate division KSB1 bacterium]
MYFTKLFYLLKPLIPRKFQIYIRSKIVRWKEQRYKNIWPISKNASPPPVDWDGWPDGKKFALVLTHDVEYAGGQKKCLQLMQLEKKAGFRSSFNFVPERYPVSKPLIEELKKNNFEVGVHGLLHDGKLYKSKAIFQQRTKKINFYLNDWNAVGFRSPAMHHNLAWHHDLNIEYDASTFDTDPFEPQSNGVDTIFPFWVQNGSTGKGYVELPYTLAQDFTQFILLKKNEISIWKKKLDWIVEKGGMALINTHPDYMNFNTEKCKQEEYSVTLYEDFLKYVKNKYDGAYWHVLPEEISNFCKMRG